MPRLEGITGLAEADTSSAAPDLALAALAATKSYTTSAVIVFLLYWLFWLPGLIFNLVYLRDARRMERLAGTSLPGAGCLTIMLAVNLIGLVLVGVIGYILLR